MISSWLVYLSIFLPGLMTKNLKEFDNHRMYMCMYRKKFQDLVYADYDIPMSWLVYLLIFIPILITKSLKKN